MKKYVKPSIETVVLETKDVITISGVVNNGQKTYEDKNGNIFTGEKGTFISQFEKIW